MYPSESDQEYVYLEVALGAGRHLARALELARLKGLDEIASRAVEVLVRKADFSLGDEKAGPGVVLRLIRPLIGDRDGSLRVDDLLVRARARYADDVFNTLSVTELQLKSSGLDAASRERLRRGFGLLDAAGESAPVPATICTHRRTLPIEHASLDSPTCWMRPHCGCRRNGRRRHGVCSVRNED